MSEIDSEEIGETVGELPCLKSPKQGLPKRRLLRQGSVSENFFAVKGAALIVPRQTSVVTENMQLLKHYGGELQIHLKAIFQHLRPQDNIKLAARLESWVASHRRYLVVVGTTGRQDTEESIIVGCDFDDKDSKTCTIGLVLPVWCDTKIQLDGDGGFRVERDDQVHTFKPVSVQAMWSALQTLNRSVDIALKNNYFEGSLYLTWTGYYISKISSSRNHVTEWTYRENEMAMMSKKSYFQERDPTRQPVEKRIRNNLKHVMMGMDLDNSTSKQIRTELEKQMDIDLKEYKEFIDTEMLVILGQMDIPSKILDHLYLGSEMNASNYEELKELGITHILNVTLEIINFFPDDFCYKAVRLYDSEDSNLLPHWNHTYKFISEAKKSGGKCLVHCRMGISRSSSTVCAYLMREKLWTKSQALEYVKECRSIICPNDGFLEQLDEYEGIVMASAQRHNKLFRSRSESSLVESTEEHPRPTPSPKHQSVNLPNIHIQNDIDGADDDPGFDLNRHLLDIASLTPPKVSRPKSWSPDEGRAPYVPDKASRKSYEQDDTNDLNETELLVPAAGYNTRENRVQSLQKQFVSSNIFKPPLDGESEPVQNDDNVFTNVCSAQPSQSSIKRGPPRSSSPAVLMTDAFSTPVVNEQFICDVTDVEADQSVAVEKDQFPQASDLSENELIFKKGHQKSPSLPPLHTPHVQEHEVMGRPRSFSEIPTSVKRLVSAIEKANNSDAPPAEGVKRSMSLPGGKRKQSPIYSKISLPQHIQEADPSSEDGENAPSELNVNNSNNNNNVPSDVCVTPNGVTCQSSSETNVVRMSASLLHAIRKVGIHLMASEAESNDKLLPNDDEISERGKVRDMVQLIESGHYCEMTEHSDDSIDDVSNVVCRNSAVETPANHPTDVRFLKEDGAIAEQQLRLDDYPKYLETCDISDHNAT